MLLENVQKLMKIHTTNQAFNTTTYDYEVLEWNVQKKKNVTKNQNFGFPICFFKKLIDRFTMIKHCEHEVT